MMPNKHILLILPQDRLGNAKSQWLKITKVYFSFTLYVCYESVKVLLFSHSGTQTDGVSNIMNITNPHREEKKIQ